MTDDDTAGEVVAEGELAFRLAEETRVYKSPDTSAEVLAVLPAGSLITVHEQSGGFLHVVTPLDSFGYIIASTPVDPVESAPEPHPGPQPQTPAGERVVPQPEGRPPAAAAVQRLAADEAGPARQWVPGERVLIYDRVGTNKRNTLFLIMGFVLFTALFFAAIGVVLSSSADVSSGDRLTLVLQFAVVAAIIALVVGVLMYYTATAAVLMISQARQVSKAEEPVLYRTVENLSIGSGLPMPKVWVIDDSAPNAMATGRNPKGAHVAATRGLLDKLQEREIEAVMAHEMSHIGNYDTRLMTAVAVVVGLVALAADLLLRFTWYGAGARSSNRGKGGGGLWLILLVLALAFIVISPIIASMMRLALSRQREYLADASGALLCRNPDALADALEKISADPEPLEVANKATAHLYIANPLKGHESLFNNLFATHPPVEERIRLLRAMA